MRMIRCIIHSDTGILRKRKSELPSGVKPITSLDALPLTFRRLIGAKAIKLGSWDLNVNVWHVRSGINVMVYFAPGE